MIIFVGIILVGMYENFYEKNIKIMFKFFLKDLCGYVVFPYMSHSH